jgi:uncharacterized protein (DUF4415 family)
MVAKRKPDPAMPDEENPEWTAEDIANARPFPEVFPEQYAVLKKRGRPRLAAPKVQISFRLGIDVVSAVRASGRNYNARVEEALRKAFPLPVSSLRAAAAAKAEAATAKVSRSIEGQVVHKMAPWGEFRIAKSAKPKSKAGPTTAAPVRTGKSAAKRKRRNPSGAPSRALG